MGAQYTWWPRLQLERGQPPYDPHCFQTHGNHPLEPLQRVTGVAHGLDRPGVRVIDDAAVLVGLDALALDLFDDATFAQSCTTKLSQGVNVTALDADTVRRMVSEGARADVIALRRLQHLNSAESVFQLSCHAEGDISCCMSHWSSGQDTEVEICQSDQGGPFHMWRHPTDVCGSRRAPD